MYVVFVSRLGKHSKIFVSRLGKYSKKNISSFFSQWLSFFAILLSKNRLE